MVWFGRQPMHQNGATACTHAPFKRFQGFKHRICCYTLVDITLHEELGPHYSRIWNRSTCAFQIIMENDFLSVSEVEFMFLQTCARERCAQLMQVLDLILLLSLVVHRMFRATFTMHCSTSLLCALCGRQSCSCLTIWWLQGAHVWLFDSCS